MHQIALKVNGVVVGPDIWWQTVSFDAAGLVTHGNDRPFAIFKIPNVTKFRLRYSNGGRPALITDASWSKLSATCRHDIGINLDPENAKG